MLKKIMTKRRRPNQVQMEFDLGRPLEKDRNAELGGRSFYFFDFDDNVAFLSTPIVLFHKDTGEERPVSSGEFARNHNDIGKKGLYKDFTMDFNDEKGSFRYFRDKDYKFFEKVVLGKKQSFVEDVQAAISRPDIYWKAPSWSYFFHATLNRRPMAIITARGHHPDTIKDGILEMVKAGHLPHEPNYLSIYPVSNVRVRKKLGDKDLKLSVAELKKIAIRESVNKAIEVYGYNAHHRFGMSDDDPKNVQLVTEAMVDVKKEFPKMSFFVIDTSKEKCIKREILLHEIQEEEMLSKARATQLSMFDFQQ